MALDDIYDRSMTDIPIRHITTFRDEIPSRSSSPLKIADLDLTDFFSKDEVSVNDIDSLTALKILHHLTQLLIIRCQNDQDDDDSGNKVSELPSPPLQPEEMEMKTGEWPLSPKKTDPAGTIYTDESDGGGVSSHFLDTTADNIETIKTPNTKIMQNKVLAKRFSLKADPPVTSCEYLERVNHYCELSAGVYLTASLYSYKLVYENEALRLNNRNIHRVLITALRISCKMIEDINHKQTFISKIGGINNKDLLSLEISFLFLIKFECQANEATLAKFLKDFRRLHAESG